MNKNEMFLTATDSKTESMILNAVAKQYGITTKEAYEEVVDPEAEKLFEYMVEPERSATYLLMQRRGMI